MPSSSQRVSILAASFLTLTYGLQSGHGDGLPNQNLNRTDVSPYSTNAQLAEGQIIQLQTHADQLPILRSSERVRLQRLPIAADLTVDLDLRRFDVFSPDARIVRGTPQGDEPIARPDVTLFGGRVVGRINSSAFLSVTPEQTQGWITIDGETFILSSGAHGAKSDLVAYLPSQLPEGMIRTVPFTCDSEQLPVLEPLVDKAETDGATPRGASPWTSSCRRADLAIETDFEYTDALFGGDLSAAAAYTATLIGAVSEIFMRDFNTDLQIVYLRLWDEDDTPWNQPSTSSQLYQFQDYWNANMTHISRNAVHFISGRPLGGGVAYRPGLCYPNYDYGLSANMNGFFPYPIENNNWQNWDLMVVTHELGHNFGAPHTHSMNPPVDQCAQGDCSVTPNGTIMSYCHICPGGLANVRMEMGDRIVHETILPLLNQPWFYDLVLPCDPVGDCNGDGVLDLADIDCFVELTLDRNPFNGPMQRSDLYNDGQVNGLDVQPFVEALLAP